MRVVCISDTHNLHNEVEIPEGDLLVHAGDFTGRGTVPEITAFNEWLITLPHRHKVVIAGNHDFLFERKPAQARPLVTNAIYLENSGVEIEGLRLWGSPIQPWFLNWAFNRERGEKIARYWKMIPSDVEVLIVHGPPQGIGDVTVRGEAVGCTDLRARMAELPNLRAMICGHIHEAYGAYTFTNAAGIDIPVMNASICDVYYKPVNQPIIIDL